MSRDFLRRCRIVVPALCLLVIVFGAAAAKTPRAPQTQSQGRIFGRVILYDDKMAVHSDEPGMLAFFDVPPETAVLCVDERGGDYRDQRSGLPNGGACEVVFCPKAEASPLPQKPGYSADVRSAACRNPQVPVPHLIRPFEDWVVAKTPGYVNLEAPFFLASTEFRGEGEGGPKTPKNPFFRVFEIDGTILYDLQEPSKPPQRVITGLGIDKNGALFGLGEFVNFFNGCDSETSPRKVRKLFLWESSGRTQTIDASEPTAEITALLARFRLHVSYMAWFKWPPEIAKEKLTAIGKALSEASDAAPLTEPIRQFIAEAAAADLVSEALYNLGGAERTAFVESASRAELTRLKRMTPDEFRQYLKRLEPEEQADRSQERRLQHEINCAALNSVRDNDALASLRSDFFERKRWNLCEIESGMED